MSDTSYLLGTHAEELERLRFQNQLWRPTARAAWARAGLQAGEQVLDLGAGPGFAALDLAAIVGPTGRVLGLELSNAYVEAGCTLAAGVDQLELRQHDLVTDPWPKEHFDLIWSRWVAMFLTELDPLLAGAEACLRPGGRWVLHEYMHWDTFGLHPHGKAIHRFGQACQASFHAAAGRSDVNRTLPATLAKRGWTIDALEPLPVVGDSTSMAGQWMERFVEVYGQTLIRSGRWTRDDAAEARAEIAHSHQQPGSFWVGPTTLEVRASRP